VHTFIVSLVTSVLSSASFVASIPSSTSPLPILFPLVPFPLFSLSHNHTLAATSSQTFSCLWLPASVQTWMTLSQTTSRQLRCCGCKPTCCRQSVCRSGPHCCNRAPHGHVHVHWGHLRQPPPPPNGRAVCSHEYLSKPVVVGPIADVDNMLMVSSPWTPHLLPANLMQMQPDSTCMCLAPQDLVQHVCTPLCLLWPQRAHDQQCHCRQHSSSPTHCSPVWHGCAYCVRAQHRCSWPLTQSTLCLLCAH
jgi:hypothetical protein